jgi:hypothetical protein
MPDAQTIEGIRFLASLAVISDACQLRQSRKVASVNIY